MTLSKATRKALYEASGPIWVKWPSQPFPRSGKTYRVSLKQGKSIGIIVSGVKLGGTEALVKLHDDPVKVLWGLKGTYNEEGKYTPEPEPVGGEWLDRQAFVANQMMAILGSGQRGKAKARKSGKGKLAAEHRARADRRLKKVVGL